MGTSLLKSSAVTNADATPPVKNQRGVDGGPLQNKCGHITTAASDDTSSVYRFVRVPSNAYVRAVRFASGATGATGQVNIGVWQTAANGGAVVDAEFQPDPQPEDVGLVETADDGEVVDAELPLEFDPAD